MWPDPWAVVAESDRAQWDYVPLERVGPLRFGMSPQEAAVAMEAGGYASDSATEITKFARLQQLRTRFRGVDTPPYGADVVAYYVDSMGLTCIAVDALSGPQVTFDGIRLIGRPPSELAAELTVYLEKTGRDLEFTTEGDVGSQELGMNPRAQRAGDVLLTRLVFGRPNDWAHTLYDCVPAEEWNVR
ncbi:hypothetical protein OG864_31930 [Streptomyces sp. NBC_00124]|uniref:hypothetical protein n=1 Tax=Streptomyces sp. NBC_00124 TaxID=2975662 RepID=UPI00224DBD63|nr:hypothetical protein [Streptomyces sp. NBC_00124]MCX5363305.1 hypothetical protein [Streptomyces sp. NBC_00124]